MNKIGIGGWTAAVAACVAAVVTAGPAGTEKTSGPSDGQPAGRFKVLNVEGWTVYVNRQVLRDEPEQWARTLEHLRWELYQIKLAVPGPAVTNMQENNAIWVECREKVDLSYHPQRKWLLDRGYVIPPDPKSMMSLSVKTHLGDSYRHPFVVFHEMAHGYDYHFIGKGRRYGNAEAQANYQRMMDEGKYERVKIWNGRVGSHYARTNRMEYWAESSEAYFAVNDIYPFVRAELRRFDPPMVRFLERYWGVDARQVRRTEQALADYLDRQGGVTGWPEVPSRRSGPGGSDGPGGRRYDKRQVGPWTVYVSSDWLAEPGRCEQMVKLVTYKLHMIDHFFSESGRRQLHGIPVRLERCDRGPYVYYQPEPEPGDASDGPAPAVVVADPEAMRRWAMLEQGDLLHGLALAYYDRQAGRQDSDLGRRLSAAYQQARQSGRYDSVLRFDGRQVYHPAMRDVATYFAELMESYFLVNDHYPFIRCQLKDHDPAGYQLMAELWPGSPRR